MTGPPLTNHRPPGYESDAPAYDFSALGAIQNPPQGLRSQRIEYIGSATSHFQAQPLLYDERGQPRVFTDWELELTRRLRGQHCGIPNADTTALPRFLDRKEEYLGRSAQLSENMFRFSLDFGRLCPKEGQFNEQLMTDYVRVLALIRARGREPFLTLHHFTMPQSLIETDREGNIRVGGWEHWRATQHFRFYIENVVRFLASGSRMRAILADFNLSRDAQEELLSEGLVRYFMTINEPTVLLFNAYLSGVFPPYKRANVLTFRRLFDRLVEAHDIAWGQIKQGLRNQRREPQIGIGHNWQCFDGLLGDIARRFQDHYMTRFEREGGNSDFLGIHYYFRWTEPLTSRERREREYSDQPTFGDVYPRGILDVIRQAHSRYPGKSVFISEFGFSDSRDLRRPYWILETVRYILEAARAGVPIRGILLWTLVNNFEWQQGMSQKFGLFSESELDKPLVPCQRRVRSWQVWRATTNAIASPTPENLRELQRMHQAAYEQYRQARGIY